MAYTNNLFKIPENASVFAVKQAFNHLLGMMAQVEPANVIINGKLQHVVRDGLLTKADGWDGDAIAPGIMSNHFSQSISARLKPGTRYVLAASYFSDADSTFGVPQVTAGLVDALAVVGTPVATPAGQQADVVVEFVTSLSFDPNIHDVKVEFGGTLPAQTTITDINCVEAGLLIGSIDKEMLNVDTRYNLTSGEWELTNDGGTTWSSIINRSNLAQHIVDTIIDPAVDYSNVGGALQASHKPIVLDMVGDVRVHGGGDLILPINGGPAFAVELDVRRVHGDLQVDGNFTVLGTNTTINSETITTTDPFIRVNADDALALQNYAGVEVAPRAGYATAPQIRWNYGTQQWEMSDENGNSGVVLMGGGSVTASDIIGAFSGKKGITVTNNAGDIDLELKVNSSGTVTAAYDALNNWYTFAIANSGVTPATYQGLTIGLDGRVTAATNNLTVSFLIPDYDEFGPLTDNGLQVVNKNYVDAVAGAGVASPSDLFDVNNNFDISGAGLYWGGTGDYGKIKFDTSGVHGKMVFETGNHALESFDFVQYDSVTSTYTTVATIGSTGITSIGFNVASSRTLKTNIEKISGALELVDKLEGVRYNWKSNPDSKTQIGMIAEDVEEVLPELVTDGSVLAPKAVNYAQMVAVLVEAVKELKAEVKELKEKLNA